MAFLDDAGLVKLWQHIQARLSNKVDKVAGKGLSTNDYTTTEKNKLSSIEEGANKTTVDSAMSSSSTNPVQNRIVNEAISNLNTLVGNKKVSEQITDTITELDMLTIDITDVEQGTATGINADTLGGKAASDYVLEDDFDAYKSEISSSMDSLEASVVENVNEITDLEINLATNYALKSDIHVDSVNGKNGDVVLNSDDVGALAISYGGIIDVLNLRWNGQTSVNVCANCDNPMYNGFYHCNDSTAGTKPSTHGELLHITENIVWSEHQLFFPSGGGIHHRHRNNNGTANSAAWSSWKQII